MDRHPTPERPEPRGVEGRAETNKILGRAHDPLPIDGLCVRVGAMRCHSQGLTIKLTSDLPMDEIEGIIASANDWSGSCPTIARRRRAPCRRQRSPGRFRSLSAGCAR